ncbi:phosphopantetheine-binding protein [Streptomyces malaysiensis subsp. malaysiensis]
MGYVTRATGSSAAGAGVSDADIAAQVRRHVAAVLPGHAVPSHVVVLPAFPLTPNGKLDRRALPVPETAGTGRGPSGPRETLMCALFEELLGVGEISADDGFTDLGGDSIKALTLVGRARRAGLTLTARDVLEHRTPAALAALAGSVGPERAAAGPLPAPLPPHELAAVEAEHGPGRSFRSPRCKRDCSSSG